MRFFSRLLDDFRNSYGNEKTRHVMMYKLLNMVLCLVALVMSVLNIITEEYVLFGITMTYSVLCVVNGLLYHRENMMLKLLFCIETTAMMCTFIVTGIPDGFSVLWTLVVPACALAVFNKRFGSAFVGAVFVCIVFFFWLPIGREVLMYAYNETFMLRFPFVYVCLYLISFYIEYIRIKTYYKLVDVERQYRWLYRHDALTGIYSRHAFYEEAERQYERVIEGETSVLLIDIDDFKTINDRFGHNIGDQVICRVSEIIRACTCEHCVSCRWGGEEFLVMMRCEHDPVATAEQIRHHVEECVVMTEDGQEVSFTVSAGVASKIFEDRADLPYIIGKADKAMYAAKANGKNQTVVDGK